MISQKKAGTIAQEIIWELEEYSMLRMVLDDFSREEREVLIKDIAKVIIENLKD